MGQHFEVFATLCTVASAIMLLMKRKSLLLDENRWHEGEYLFITNMLEGVLSQTYT